ncbi:MAG: hypothetical protein V8T62_05885 [Oscillospiraceae bacterium]
MRHTGTIRLETPRLVLRRFREDDAAPAFRNWESDEKVTEFLRWSPCQTPGRDQKNSARLDYQLRQNEFLPMGDCV